MSDIIRAKQDAHITVKLGLLTLASTTRRAVLSVQGQVPPQLVTHTFFGIDVAIDCLLADALLGSVKDHPVADLLGRPADFKPGHNVLT